MASPVASCQHDSERSSVMFDPPVYRQRYNWVVQMIKQLCPKKVVDMGCSECGLMQKLIRTEGLSVEELIGVDIDNVSLECNLHKVKPLMAEYLNPHREHSLTVKLYQGSVSEPDARLQDADLIACLELIEHLEVPVLSQFPHSLFGVLNPKMVILTTPNADFNVLFPDLTGFRHWDHKFEWSRVEFKSWCNDVAKKYSYNIEYGGVGDPPRGSVDLGHCSQIAVFTRSQKQQYSAMKEPYKLVVEYCYPLVKQKLSHEEKVLREVNYYTDILRRAQPTGETLQVHVPLERLMVFPCIKALCSDVRELRAALLKTDSVAFDSTGDYIVTSLSDDALSSEDESSNSSHDEIYNNNYCDDSNESWD